MKLVVDEKTVRHMKKITRLRQKQNTLHQRSTNSCVRWASFFALHLKNTHTEKKKLVILCQLEKFRGFIGIVMFSYNCATPLPNTNIYTFFFGLGKYNSASNTNNKIQACSMPCVRSVQLFAECYEIEQKNYTFPHSFEHLAMLSLTYSKF